MVPENHPRARRRGLHRLSLALLIGLLVPMAATQAAAADDSPVPENVAAYFATGLIPRLADLYGTAGNSDPDTTFDSTTKVGAIQRLLAWTPEFLAGDKTDNPTELTNTWIAPVTAKSGAILGLAAVWINPGNNKAELADFSRGRALVDALGRAPKDTQLIDDTVQQAWFATDGKTLTPLVTGNSGTSGPLTIAEYQKILRAKAVAPKPPAAPANPGLLIAGITLGGVVVLLAIFILLPGRKRKSDTAADALKRPRRNPRGESERAFDRQASTTEARAISRARAAVSAEAGLVDAMADAADRASHHAPTELHAVVADEASQKDAHATPRSTPQNPTPQDPASPKPATATATATAQKSPAPQKLTQAKSAQKKPAQKKPSTAKSAPESAPGSASNDAVAQKPTSERPTPKTKLGSTPAKKPSSKKPAPKKAAPKKPASEIPHQ